MKKLFVVVGLILSITALQGCEIEESGNFETMGNIEIENQEKIPAGLIDIYLPDEAAAQTGGADSQAEVYVWDNYEVRMETLPGGDIIDTMETITGMNADQLTIMTQEKENMTLYQTVWSCTGEDETFCGKAMVADDGNYHYCVSLMSPENVNSDQLYAQLVGSFQIRPENFGK